MCLIEKSIFMSEILLGGIALSGDFLPTINAWFLHANNNGCARHQDATLQRWLVQH
ncbi:hypothetical protein LMG31886_10680 [Xanthomonas hydrangeae]|nr:hypothetical protein LMG31885_04810 [Xanthomonas hydrangeae]CAD7722623.1 hypothetical protein LMG31885_04810 [Xanthomonas hydrangeae]CAD7727668.1 hypothetical protein LMG31886_10680 [Xanthomonas hydrangeae]CAD7727672.1 hypothetical protein LMG31886_10680 [Xanthomonas hydrangeae]